MNEYYCKFFVVKYKKKWKDYDTCLKYHLNSIIKYYNEFGKDGFLSERVYKDDIEFMAKTKANMDWKMEEMCSCTMEKININPLLEKSIISMVENRKDFIRWVEQ